MINSDQIQDKLSIEESDLNKLPSMLNVLTILTYIGCGILGISAIYSYFSICKSAELLSSKEMPEIGGAIGSLMDSAIEVTIKQCDQRLVILVASLVSIILCFLGALMMRSLKKQGFILYTLGELIGPISMMVILEGSFFGSIMMVIGLIFPVAFIILYASQRKFLIN